MATKKTTPKSSRAKTTLPTPPAPAANGGETARKIAEQDITATLARVSQTSLGSISQSLNDLRARFATEALTLQGDIESAYEKYEDINAAIEASTERLTTLYAIEKEAQDLDAYRTKAAAEKAELDAEIQAARDEWDAQDEERQAERAREEQEFQYELKLKRKKEQDAWDDSIAKRNREEKIRQEEVERDLKARQAAMTAAEEELKTLRTRAAGFDSELQKAKDAGIGQGKGMEKREAEVAAKLAQAEFDKQIALLNGQLASLTTQNASLSSQVDAAQNAARMANEKLAEISRAALDSASQQNTITTLQNALASNGASAKAGR